MKTKLISSFIISCYILLVYFILKEIILINAVPNIGILIFSIITITLAIANIVNAIVTTLKHSLFFVQKMRGLRWFE